MYNGLFIIVVIVFIFAAWVATGGPTHPIAHAGPFITPVTRPGEESQGYRYITPTNPIDTSSYPRQVGGSNATISSGPDNYTRHASASNASVYLDPSSIGARAQNPDQEYVTIENTGAASASVSGWSISSRATHSSLILPALQVPAAGKLIVITGRGTPALTNTLCTGATPCFFANRTVELYAPSNETVTLMNANGATVDSFSY